MDNTFCKFGIIGFSVVSVRCCLYRAHEPIAGSPSFWLPGYEKLGHIVVTPVCANALCEQCFCQRKSMRNATSCALSNIERLCAAFCETGIETQTVLLKCVRVLLWMQVSLVC